MTRIVLASHNAKKLAELRRVMAATGAEFDVVGLDDLPSYPEPDETETTFEGNALLKAREAAARTGLPCLADDSGIEVDALNKMPGVRSARWSGPDATDERNVEWLLAQTFDVTDRTGRFVCVMALATPAGETTTTRGVMEGRLATSPAGEHGFGYDPIFVADGHDVTTAQLEPAAKDAISHRGKALRAMVEVLTQWQQEGRL